MSFICPDKSCHKCHRLLEFRTQNERKFPNYYNGPVPSFGSLEAEILVVGMAPGLNGANQTARPFTNDYAGDVLYPILKNNGLAAGEYLRRKDDGFELINVRVTNAVRCVPPQNKVIGQEVKNCGEYLRQELADMHNLKVILTLGVVAHNAVLSILGYRQSAHKFAHGATHVLENHGLLLLDSYHTSRYNINTGVLTVQMFDEVVKKLKKMLLTASC